VWLRDTHAHTHTHIHLVEILWTMDRPVAGASTCTACSQEMSTHPARVDPAILTVEWLQTYVLEWNDAVE
jgi:hypothetical protein